MSLKITLVSETFLPQTNGVSKVLGRLVDHALAQGYRVQLVIPNYKEREGNRLPDELGLFSLPFPLYPEVRMVFSRPSRVWARIKEFQPDLIHIATEGPLGLSILLKARRGPFPVVSSYHTNFAQYARHYYTGFLEKTCWNYLRWFHNQSPRTYCPSSRTREDLIQRGFKNVEVWARGIETDLFHPGRRSERLREELGLGADEVLAVYCGRIAKEKNLPALLKAFNQLRSERKDVKLMLIGDGPYRAHLEHQKPEGVFCVGYKRGEELARHFASGDFFWFPSVTETFGNVVIEALASGLPVVGFRAGGVPHSVHHGENGFLAEPDDLESFIEGARRLCEDASLRRKFSTAAVEYAQSQTWENIFQGLFDSYQRLLQEIQEQS